MNWSDVTNWVMQGGSLLGTQKQLPTKHMDKIASVLEQFQIHGLLLIGGFEVSNILLLFIPINPTKTFINIILLL